MLYTAELAKEYLEHCEDVGNCNAEIQKDADPIIRQVGDMLLEQKHSMRKLFNHSLSDVTIEYLEHTGMNIEYSGSMNPISGKEPYCYTFTF